MNYNKKSVEDIDVAGKRVLCRCDFNVPTKDGKITSDKRIVAALPTIQYLVKHNARVILCSHMGKPKGEVKPELSLQVVADRLSELLGQPVKMAKDVVGESAQALAASLKDGEVMLLENTRFEKGETKNDPAFAKALADMADIFFLRQKETKGLGHAILCGKSFVGDEPFVVLYGDDVIISEDPVTAQLCRCYEKYGKGVVGVKEVPEDLIKLYCTLGVSPIEGETRAMNCHKIIEKPTPDQVMSLYAILGRVVLPPEVFGMLEKGLAETPEGQELYLTDVMSELGARGELLAYDFDGKRYDMGNKFGILQAQIEIGLEHPETKDLLKDYIKNLAKTL